MSICPATPSSILDAGARLARGELVGLPTETVYGLAADAWNDTAIAQVFEVKKRPANNPLIVHIAPQLLAQDKTLTSAIEQLGVIDLGAYPQAQQQAIDTLLATHWPGPLSVVLPKGRRISELTTAGSPWVALRMPDHAVALAIITAANRPLVAPSANRSGSVSPTCARDVEAELGDAVALIVDGGPCRVGIESTVAWLKPNQPPQILRPGAIAIAQLSSFWSEEATRSIASNPRLLSDEAVTQVPSPGQAVSHYAPQTRCILISNPINPHTIQQHIHAELRIAVLSQAPLDTTTKTALAAYFVAPPRFAHLSQQGDVEDAARRLYHMLRKLDGWQVDAILIETITGHGSLTLAINDRIQRCCATHRLHKSHHKSIEYKRYS